jgi:hypothetical protein
MDGTDERAIRAQALVALAIAGDRSLEADPVTGPWLPSHVEVAVPALKASISLIHARLALPLAMVRLEPA